MELKQISCPHCGGILQLNIGERKIFTCPYCDGSIYFDDGVQRTEKTKNINKKIRIEKINHKIYTDEAKIIRERNVGKKNRMIFLSVLALIIAIALSGFYFGAKVEKQYILGDTVVLDKKGHTIAEFARVIMGKAEQKAMLIVDEQEVSIATTITKKGWFDWDIFSKSQLVTYYGTAQYTVDLSKMSDEDIVYDEDKNVLTVKVPKPKLNAIVFNSDKTVVGDLEKGFLAFGKINLSPEQIKELETDAIEKLKECANESSNLDKACELAKYVLRDLFEDPVEDIDSSTKVQIELVDTVK